MSGPHFKSAAIKFCCQATNFKERKRRRITEQNVPARAIPSQLSSLLRIVFVYAVGVTPHLTSRGHTIAGPTSTRTNKGGFLGQIIKYGFFSHRWNVIENRFEINLNEPNSEENTIKGHRGHRERSGGELINKPVPSEATQEVGLMRPLLMSMMMS